LSTGDKCETTVFIDTVISLSNLLVGISQIRTKIFRTIILTLELWNKNSSKDRNNLAKWGSRCGSRIE
jgi:hypothetical protein